MQLYHFTNRLSGEQPDEDGVPEGAKSMFAGTHNVRAEMMRLPRAERERIHFLAPGPDRWKERSRTFEGIAEAMAAQWSDYSDLVTQMEAA